MEYSSPRRVYTAMVAPFTGRSAMSLPYGGKGRAAVSWQFLRLTTRIVGSVIWLAPRNVGDLIAEDSDRVDVTLWAEFR